MSKKPEEMLNEEQQVEEEVSQPTKTLAQQVYDAIKHTKGIVLVTNFGLVNDEEVSKITVIANVSNDRVQLVKAILKIAMTELGNQVAYTDYEGKHILLNPEGKAIQFLDYSKGTILC